MFLLKTKVRRPERTFVLKFSETAEGGQRKVRVDKTSRTPADLHTLPLFLSLSLAVKYQNFSKFCSEGLAEIGFNEPSQDGAGLAG